MAVVVVLRRGVEAVPSAASKASRSASRALRTTRVSMVRRGRDVGTLGPPIDRIELAAGGQHGVANLLGIEPPDGSFPEQAVLGIESLAGSEVALAALSGLTIGRGSQDQPMQRLDVPAARDEFRRQPVEQLGMAGCLAHAAEVARRAGQAPPEMVLPDPVDDDAGREGIVGPAQPASQGQPPPRGLRGRGRRFDSGRPGIEHREISRLDRLLLAVARNHGRRRNRPEVGRRQHRRRRNRPQCIVTLELSSAARPTWLWPLP